MLDSDINRKKSVCPQLLQNGQETKPKNPWEQRKNQDRKKGGQKTLFSKIMAENSPNLGEEWTFKSNHCLKTNRCDLTTNEETMSKVLRDVHKLINKPVRITLGHSTETIKPEWHMMISFKS